MNACKYKGLYNGSTSLADRRASDTAASSLAKALRTSKNWLSIAVAARGGPSRRSAVMAVKHAQIVGTHGRALRDIGVCIADAWVRGKDLGISFSQCEGAASCRL